MYKLTAKSKIEVSVKFRNKVVCKTEDVYTYESDDGAKVTFHSHPTKSFNYVIVPESTNDAGRKVANNVIDLWIDALSLSVNNKTDLDTALASL